MNKSIALFLTLLFSLTVVAGVLTPNEAEELEKFLVSSSEDAAERDAIQEPKATTTTSDEQSTGAISVKSEKNTKNDTNLKTLYPVVRVVDGDTIIVNKDGVNESVRLIGIDTPETVHPSKPVQCFGDKASEKTKELLEGKLVELIPDEGERDRDKYYRLLRYVYRDDGMFINLELIKQGYAYEYTYIEPYKYQQDFMEAESEAMEAKRGLWAESACE